MSWKTKWLNYLREGEVVDFQQARMKKAIEEFQQIFDAHYDDVGYNSAADDTEVREFIQHLETKSVEGALKAIGYLPHTLGMDQLGEIYMWVDKWFSKRTMLEEWKRNLNVEARKKAIKENWKQYLVEGEQKVIITYFGGFKPPHRGHLAVVEDYLSKSEVEKIYIVFGPGQRKSTDGTLAITGEDTRKIWNLYLESIGIGDTVEIIEADKGSAMKRAAEMAFNPEFKGMLISPGCSAKEPGHAKRFSDIIRGLEREKGPAVAEATCLPSDVNVSGVSATKLRNALASGDHETIKQMIPDNISLQQFLSLFN